jgi:hypothetical protein
MTSNHALIANVFVKRRIIMMQTYRSNQRYALRHSDYDGKGAVHFAGSQFNRENDPADMRTFKTEANAKATNEFKYWHYEVVPVVVSIEVL